MSGCCGGAPQPTAACRRRRVRHQAYAERVDHVIDFGAWEREAGGPWVETRASVGATWDMHADFILATLFVLGVVALVRSSSARAGAASYGFPG